MPVILQFIPILLIMFYLHYEKIFAATFRSVLGRLILLIIIVLYTAYNKMVGAVVCLLVVMYYQQTDVFIESMVSMTPKTPSASTVKVSTVMTPEMPKASTTTTVMTPKTPDVSTTKASSTDTTVSLRPLAPMERQIPVLSRFLPAPVTEPFDNWSPNQDTSLFTK